MSLGVLWLAGCATIPGERAATPYSIRGGDPVAANAGPTQMPTLNPADTRIGRPVFGTVNPGARPGRRLLSQHLIGQLPFGMRYADSDLREAASDKLGAARTTEVRERWMDRVTANNNAFRAGRGQALMVGINPSNPMAGAEDMYRQYQRLIRMVDVNNPNRQENAEILLQSYRDTLAARQDTAMLLQAERRIEHFQDYARLEAGRRVLGDVLIRGGVVTERTVERDYAGTYGFLRGTEIGLAAFQGRNFGPSQVLLADDRSQRAHRLEGTSEIENRAVNQVFRGVEREARRFQQIEAELARQTLNSLNRHEPRRARP
ncbi:MAG: hypothetical protein AAF213_01720 [Pseudomonadota bacterium]